LSTGKTDYSSSSTWHCSIWRNR